MRHRRRIWCEMLPCRELAEPRALGLLRRFSIAPIIAAWPSTDVAELARSLAAIEGEGLQGAIWPMLADRDGRWVNAQNAAVFVGFVQELTQGLARQGRPVAEIAIDLEPSIEALRSSAAHAHFLPISFDRRGFGLAKERLRALGEALHEASVQVSAAVPPTVLLDAAGAGPRPFEELLGTPVEGLAWDHVSVMLYTSMIEGWSRRVLRREDARALLAAATARAGARFGDRAGVSLGCVGVGAFGNEPVYRSALELADDVAIARAAGVDDLTLFDLGGVLRRPDPEAWLDAFTETPPASRVPPRTLRAGAILAGARLAGGAAYRLSEASAGVFGALGGLGRR